MKLQDKNLYFVGGVVRDEMLGSSNFDVDFCYEGNAIDFAKQKDLEIIKVNPDFGTVRVLIDSQDVDIASTRQETYPEVGHLPKVQNIGCSLKEDLARRDFTVNAMAKNTLTNEVVDYFGGISDIKAKKLRVLHDKSFIEDPSRILRGLKFSVRFGFDLDENTKRLQEEYLLNINYDMSFHRLKKELKETFNLNKDEAYFKFINDGIYKLLGVNEIAQCPLCKISEFVEKYSPSNVWLVYLGCFNFENFELTSEEQNILKEFSAIKNTFPKTDFEIYKMFKNKPLESVLIYGAFINKEIAAKYLDCLINIKLETTGDDLAKLGIPQGKIYKEILERLEEEKINNPTMNYDDEISFVKSKYRLFI